MNQKSCVFVLNKMFFLFSVCFPLFSLSLTLSTFVAALGCVLKVGVMKHFAMPFCATTYYWLRVKGGEQIKEGNDLHIATVGRFVTQSLQHKHENSLKNILHLITQPFHLQNKQIKEQKSAIEIFLKIYVKLLYHELCKGIIDQFTYIMLTICYFGIFIRCIQFCNISNIAN